MASGCLGLVSFPREPGRVTLERLGELHPRLRRGAARAPGHRLRARALGGARRGRPRRRAATHYLDEERVEGEDPLAPFGPNAAAHVRRTDGFAHCPDVLVNAAFSPDTEEVAAFEELVGSHGGMGGSQSFPFVLFPRALPYPERGGRRRRARCTACCAAGWPSSGHDAYRDEAQVTAAAGGGSPPAAR